MSSNQYKATAVYEMSISGLALNEHEASRLVSKTYGVHGFAKDDLIGVAGWRSDKSDVSQAARDSLQRSAGITVPSIDFIAKVLGIYLAILVPVNWLLFKLIGRVEMGMGGRANHQHWRRVRRCAGRPARHWFCQKSHRDCSCRASTRLRPRSRHSIYRILYVADVAI